MLKKWALALLVVTSTSTAFAWTCATAYQGTHFTGYALNIQDGARIRNLSHYSMNYRQSWNNRISSLVVEEGCRLVGYQYNDFGRDYDSGRRIGARESFYGPGSYAYLNTDDLISSLTCSCR